MSTVLTEDLINSLLPKELLLRYPFVCQIRLTFNCGYRLCVPVLQFICTVHSGLKVLLYTRSYQVMLLQSMLCIMRICLCCLSVTLVDCVKMARCIIRLYRKGKFQFLGASNMLSE